MLQAGRKLASNAAVGLVAIVLAAGAISGQAAPAANQAQKDYTQADVEFVQGMIYHHAQAVVMSDWAPTHGARPDLITLCRRIGLSQRDEINMMQHWLEDRHLPTPDPLNMLPADSGRAHDSGSMGDMSMPGMSMGDHSIMPGMLTPAQLKQLDTARGIDFDRLYLTDMIRHHEGALGMVAKLFDAPGSGQQPDLFNFATDVDAGQRAEITRMQAMLNTLNTSQTR
ncbi:MAG: DUF305 domain-containing protein [Gemmatimonadota bacterium]|nr:DUF305 domain-containing protein [Gemmatimonadota bacterium]